MINYKKIGITFTVRAAGVLINSDRVLVHKLKNDTYWTIPGGRIDINEKSEDALVREFKEELDADIKIKRLLWVLESFFEYNAHKFHEISFIYLIEEITDKITKKDFEAKEGNKHYYFKWVDLNKLSEIVLKPEFLIHGINNLPHNIIHIKYEQ